MRLAHICLIGAILLGTPVAIAHWTTSHPLAQRMPPPDRPLEGERPNPRRLRERGGMIRRLNLTPDQAQQLWQLRSQYQPEIRDRAQRMQATQAELRQLMGSTATNDEVQAKFQQVQQLRQEKLQLRMESILAMREILTPEQRRTLIKELEQRRTQRRGRRF